MGYFVAKMIAKEVLMIRLRERHKVELANLTMTENDIVNIFTELWGAEGPDCRTVPALELAA